MTTGDFTSKSQLLAFLQKWEDPVTRSLHSPVASAGEEAHTLHLAPASPATSHMSTIFLALEASEFASLS